MKMRRFFYLSLLTGAVAAHAAPLVSNPINSSEFKSLFPVQYERWTASKSIDQTEDVTATYPEQVILRAGTGGPSGPTLLGLRGHYYAWIDAAETDDAGLPTGNDSDTTTSRCLLCHSTVGVAMIEKEGELEFASSTWTKYGNLGPHSIGCINCHNPDNMSLRIVPQWVDVELKKANLKTFSEASAREKRSMLCLQCHYENYSTTKVWIDQNGKKREATVSNGPWKNGFSVEAMESFYNDGNNFEDGKPLVDWVHPISRTPMLFSEHPDYELFKIGNHGRSGVECTDCHMPAMKTEAGQSYTEHKIMRPIDNIDNTCLVCHKGQTAESMRSFILTQKNLAEQKRVRIMKNLAKAHLEAGKAWEVGASEAEMKTVLADIRSVYFKFNSVARAAYFHSPEETFKVLDDAEKKIENARSLLKEILTTHGSADYVAPEFKTKDEAIAYLGLKLREKGIEDKCEAIRTVFPQWEEAAKKAGTFDHDHAYPKDMESWRTRMCQSGDKQ